MKISELQHNCNKKLAMSYEHSGTNFEQIRRIANKSEPLTEQDVAQLTHFANSNKAKLEQTVYYGNAIVQPSTYNIRYYRKLVSEGWVETSKNYARIHYDDK